MSAPEPPPSPLERPSPAALVALGVVALFAIGMHLYFAHRLVRDAALPQPWAAIAEAVLWAALLVLFAHPWAERRFGPAAGGVLGWPAYIWLGCCFYLLLSLSVSDLALAAAGAHGTGTARARAIAVCALVGLAVVAGARSALRPPALRRVELSLEGWPRQLDGYRVVQISDIHVGSLIRAAFTRELVARCNAREPDLIAITGDLVDGSVEHYRADVAPLGGLRARDGVYFVTGNHDHFSGADPWVSAVEDLGIEVLRNRRVRIARTEAAFELAGVDDYSSARAHGRVTSADNLDAALRGFDGELPLLLLAHDPRSFEQAKDRGIALQLSGHTHGGQLWPFNALVRLQTRYVAGIYRHGRSVLYVSRGTGFWGPPMRLLSPAEITEVVLRSS